MITPSEMNTAINYMAAANLFNLTAGMATIWADYVNEQIPDADHSELIPAAKQIIKDKTLDRTLPVLPETLVKAICKIRAKRISSERSRGGDIHPVGIDAETDSRRYQEWMRITYGIIGRGGDRAAAEAYAYDKVGAPRPQALPAREMNIKPLIQQALRAAKKVNE